MMDIDSNVSAQNQNTPILPRNANLIWVLIGVVVLFVAAAIAASPATPTNSITLDQLTAYIQEGDVDAITVRGGTDVLVRLDDGSQYFYHKERETDLLQQLQIYGITSEQLSSVQYQEMQGDQTGQILLQLAVAIIPILIIIGLLWLMMNRSKVVAEKEKRPPL